MHRFALGDTARNNVKSKTQLVGESDSFTTRNESAPQSLAAGLPDSLRSNPTKESATSLSPVDAQYHGHAISGVVDAILEVGRERNKLLAQLRAALESGKERDALNLARRLCGLPHEESDRTNQSID